MQRPAFKLFIWLFFTASSGAAADVAAVQPMGHSAGMPSPGHNFTLAQPALALVWIAPGTFVMSSTHGAGDDTSVTLTRGYWLGRTEVTQAQWQAVMDRVPVPSFHKGSDRPVERVSWDVAVEFCLTLTHRERAGGRLPAGYSYTLPTEAQWEYACRAGTTGIYAGKLDDMAWHSGNSEGQTHPVAQKQPNAWGLYDMHGSVQEWCADWYGGYPGGEVNDPSGAPLGQFRVIRGGAWGGSAGLCRSALRAWTKPAGSNPTIGFRLALTHLDVPPSPAKRDDG